MHLLTYYHLLPIYIIISFFFKKKLIKQKLAFLGAILNKTPETEIPEIDRATSLWLKQAPWRRQDDGSYGKRTSK